MQEYKKLKLKIGTYIIPSDWRILKTEKASICRYPVVISINHKKYNNLVYLAESDSEFNSTSLESIIEDCCNEYCGFEEDLYKGEIVLCTEEQLQKDPVSVNLAIFSLNSYVKLGIAGVRSEL